ncbi:hypothetical protein ACJ73_09461 [Blastomyces percursus]|uniref:Uncharacterized protein n=1 Tax=Blastomyces percursus TaxID=1658174 RepID=A0A1J9PVC6_9EURO|nr:hypothetical protein ACJ73_09461 [Blastomyces percursus]
MQFEHRPTGDGLWKTKRPTPQRPQKLSPSSKRIFHSTTVSGVQRGYDHGNQHNEQKWKQYPLPSSQILRPQTISPEYKYDPNNNDHEKPSKHPPQLYRETLLYLPLEIKHAPQPLYTPFKKHGQKQLQQLSLRKSDNNNNISPPIHPTSPSTASSRPSTQKEAPPLPNLLPFLARVVQQGPHHWRRNHTHHRLSSTADKLLRSQMSSSHLSSSSSSSYPLRTTGGRFLSRDKEIRGSFLGMVVCVVVSVMWI